MFKNTLCIRIFITTLILVTSRSRCSDFYLINEGPQNIRVPGIFSKLKSDQSSLGNTALVNYSTKMNLKETQYWGMVSV
jgi:hypothetical protein